MDYTALKNELLTDPNGLGYADYLAVADDVGLAEVLNQKRYRGPVPIIDISAYCIINGIIGACEVAAQSSETPAQLKAVCITVTTLLRDDFRLNTCDTDHPAFAFTCDALIAASLMTEDQKADMLALGENQVSRAAQVVGMNVSPFDVGSARNL